MFLILSSAIIYKRRAKARKINKEQFTRENFTWFLIDLNMRFDESVHGKILTHNPYFYALK